MFYFGLDLGQTADPSASIILEANGEGDTRTYDARHLEQYPLGTSYPDILQAVCATLARDPLRRQCVLVIDHTGVGRPIFDLFVDAKIRPIVGMTITGGVGWHRETPQPMACQQDPARGHRPEVFTVWAAAHRGQASPCDHPAARAQGFSGEDQQGGQRSVRSPRRPARRSGAELSRRTLHGGASWSPLAAGRSVSQENMMNRNRPHAPPAAGPVGGGP